MFFHSTQMDNPCHVRLWMLQPLYMLRDVLVRLVLLLACCLLHDVSYAAADYDDDGDGGGGRADHYLGPLLYMAATTGRVGGRVCE